MYSKIWIGLVLGLAVSFAGSFYALLPLKKAGQNSQEQTNQKTINRYFLKNFANLIFLGILFKTTDTITLVAAGAGLTIARFFLFAKEYIIWKGVN